MQRRALLANGLLCAPLALLAAETAHAADDNGYDLITRADVVRWIRRYSEAWRDKDPAAAVELFTEDAVYQAIPGVRDQTFMGRSEIGIYWANITSGQSNITIHHGEPLVQGNRAMIELWVTLQAAALNPDGAHWITLIETNVLSFADPGHVYRNVEYWNLQMGILERPPGWGTQ